MGNIIKFKGKGKIETEEEDTGDNMFCCASCGGGDWYIFSDNSVICSNCSDEYHLTSFYNPTDDDEDDAA